MSDIKKQIVDSIKNDNFLETVYQSYFDAKSDSEESLGLILTTLHKERHVNLVEQFLKLNRKTSQGDFFTLRHVFSKALPLLDAPTNEVMKTVKHLTIQAEGDMTQGLLIGPFIEYCKNSPLRIDEVLSESLLNFDETFDFVSPALIAGAETDLVFYFEKAIDLVTNPNTQLETLKRAIFSLGRMAYKEAEQPRKAFDIILKRLPEVDSQSFSICLRSLFNIYLQDFSLDREFLGFVTANSNRFDDLAIHNISDLLFLNDAQFSDAVQNQLLEIVARVKPENKGTIDNIDWALVKLFEKGRPEVAIKCFESICMHSGHQISIQKFDSFSRKLIENPDAILSKTITKWFLSKNISLCRQASELLQNPYFDKSIEIECDLPQIDINNQFSYLFLSRKAIGWFYMRPISAISFILSMIKTCPKNELLEIENICFQPLLISYPGSVKKHLESKAKNSNQQVKAFCKKLLSRLQLYHAGLDSAQKIKELRPSAQDRYAYNRHHQRLMNESVKTARSSSLLSQLGVQESVLLYGNKSISYIHTGPDNKVRQEIPLHQFSTSVEFPSLEVLDPCELDWSLRMCRVEGCKS